MSHQRTLTNKINLVKLSLLFLKLNGGEALPSCLIIDDFWLDNKYLHVAHDYNSYQVKFFILNDEFLKYQLSVLLEIVKDPTRFDIEQIWINKKNISDCLEKNNIYDLDKFLTEEVLFFKNKKEPKSLEINLLFVWTISANNMAYCSIYF